MRKTGRRAVLFSAIVLAPLTAGSVVQAGELSLGVAGGSVSLPVTSLREHRFRSVIQQRYDFSCGSAAIATLLSHHYGRKVTEEQAFEAMFRSGNQAAIQRFGFSMLDMKSYLATLGLRADGFQVTLDQLAAVGVPAITLINTKGFKHFVVIKGLYEGQILVGDPALGLRVYERAEFEEIWDRVLFIVRDEVPAARANFNQVAEWKQLNRAPLDNGVNRQGLGTRSLMLPGFNEF